MPYLSLSFQFGQRGPALLDPLIWIGPVNLVQVDDIHLQTTQTLLDLAPDRISLEHTNNLAIRCPCTRALGKDIGTPGSAFQGASNNFFGMAKSIDCGGINPVDTKIDCPLNRGNRIIVILWPPGGRPALTPHSKR